MRFRKIVFSFVGIGRKSVSFTAPTNSIVTVVVPAEEIEVAGKPLA